MSSRKLFARWLLLLIASTAVGQQQRYIVLPQSAGNLGSFRLFGDDTQLGSWMPSQADVEGLEANLSQISALGETGWKSTRHIESPERYYRQYMGVTARRKRLIYINAFCDDPPPPDWKTRLLVVADGWTCYWQVFYDPVTKQFSNLTINGRA
ncbi:MAG: hypothetical protein ACLPLZ_09055 [Terracidiphilus sp.]